MIRLCALFFCLTTVLSAQQNQYPSDYFGSPLGIPLLLSGNFGELRTNHFHAGIDIKTNGVEGYKVYAVAEGFVSRIKVQERGYGNVIYITHPNGYTTVYAHLQRLQGAAADSLKSAQYQQQSFTVDLNFTADQLPVKKGETIGLSGNSGGSGGAHLHFEIRETYSEIPVNPLLFNLPIKDNISPYVMGIAIYPKGINSTVNGKEVPNYLKVIKNGNQYKCVDTIQVNGKIGIGVRAVDYLNNSRNPCGVFDIRLKVNEQEIFAYRTEKISFDESRYINAHCDYRYKKETGKWVHQLFKLPNDGLSAYPIRINDGIIKVEKDSIYNVTVELKDVYGNLSYLKAVLKGNAKTLNSPFYSSLATELFSCTTANVFSTDSFKLFIPDSALYEDVEFKYQQVVNKEHYSNVHAVHQYTTPLHKNANMAILCTKPMKDSSKAVVIRMNKKYKSYLTGVHQNGWMRFESRYFGTFMVSEDWTKPVVKNRSIYPGKDVSKQSRITFKIWDSKSGIASYRGEINGQWVLFEYDAKKKQLRYNIDSHVKVGKNQLVLSVKDKVGNENVFKCSFYNGKVR